MHLIDKQDDAAFRRSDFLQHGFQPLLELAAVFCTRNQRAEIERQQLLVLEAFRHVTIDDPQRQAFDDRGLADAGLADQHRIVLGAAREHLDGAADFLVTPDHRVKLAVTRRLGQVARIFLQRVIGVLGRGAVGGTALAQGFDRSVQILRGDAAFSQDAAGTAVFLQRQPEQQPLDGDKTVTGFVGGFFGGIERARQLGREINLSGAASGNFRQLVESVLGGFQNRAGIAAGTVDQTAGEAFAVIQQHLQDMQRRKLLVSLAHR